MGCLLDFYCVTIKEDTCISYPHYHSLSSLEIIRVNEQSFQNYEQKFKTLSFLVVWEMVSLMEMPAEVTVCMAKARFHPEASVSTAQFPGSTEDMAEI